MEDRDFLLEDTTPVLYLKASLDGLPTLVKQQVFEMAAFVEESGSKLYIPYELRYEKVVENAVRLRFFPIYYQLQKIKKEEAMGPANQMFLVICPETEKFVAKMNLAFWFRDSMNTDINSVSICMTSCSNEEIMPKDHPSVATS